MRIAITGAGGMLGKKLTERILARGGLEADGQARAVGALTLIDAVPFEAPAGAGVAVDQVIGDVADQALIGEALAEADGVFHLAAVVSAAAEAEFEQGYRVNVEGTRAVLEACRMAKHAPRLVFSSTIAVFGGDLPETVDDRTTPTPESSYGAWKAMGELMVAEYARRGFVDARTLRFPTIAVRPGAPNRAASTFASSIIREPLTGREAVCPVGPDLRMWILSPRRAADALLRAFALEPARWGSARPVNLPGLTVRIGDLLAALERVGGKAARARVRVAPDPEIERIVASWPARFAPERALALGFEADGSVDAVIAAFIADELGGLGPAA